MKVTLALLIQNRTLYTFFIQGGVIQKEWEPGGVNQGVKFSFLQTLHRTQFFNPYVHKPKAHSTGRH